MSKDGIELLAEACVNAELDIDYAYDKYYVRGFIRGYIEARDPAREERTKLVTQLDICRESLANAVKENEQLKIDYAIYEACKLEMNRLYKENMKTPRDYIKEIKPNDMNLKHIAETGIMVGG